MSSNVWILFGSWGRWVGRNRGLAVLIVTVITVLLGGAGLRTIQADGMPVDFTPQALFIDSGPAVDRLRAIEADFGREDNDLSVLIQGDLQSGAGVAYLRALHDALTAHPSVERVDSLASATVLTGDDGLLTLIEPLEGPDPAKGLRIAADDPLLRRLVISKDGQTTAMRVRIDRDLHRVGDLGPALRALVDISESIDRPQGFTTTFAGVPYVRVEVADLMVRDQLRFIPLVGLCFAVTICLLFRRVGLGLAPLITMVVADIWAVGAMVAAGVTFNILSVLIPTLVLVIGVADGIHICARYREELEGGLDRVEALGRTMEAMALPCFLTTFTTAAAFGSLLVAGTSVVRAFGLHSAIAMLACFAAVMVVMPVWLSLLPAERVVSPAASAGGATALDRALRATDAAVRRSPVGMLAASGLAIAIAFAIGSGVETNSHLLEVYPEDSPTRAAVELAERELGGVIPIFVHIRTEPDGLKDPDLLGRIAALEAEMGQQAPVLWTASLAGFVGHVHQQLTGSPGLPDTRQAIAQELLLAEMAGGEPLAGLASPDLSQARILALASDAGGRAYRQMEGELEDSIADIFAGSAATVVLTGDGLLASAGVDRLITDLMSSLGLAFLMIALTLAVLLRDVRLVAVSSIPNVVPLVFTLGALGLMGADLQASNVVPFTVAVGLAVDDTIHFVVRYQRERGRNQTTQAAISQTVQHAGLPIVLTSALLVIGFAVLTTSDLTGTRHFGILSSVTMVAALLGDLVILPAMLHLVDRSG